MVEVHGEVLEEVGLVWVVAVAVDDFALEGVGVELEVGFDFFLDVDVLGIELVLLGGPRSARGLLGSAVRFFSVGGVVCHCPDRGLPQLLT